MNAIERLKTVAGEDFNSRECRVTNPRITARESIEIADYIVSLEKTVADSTNATLAKRIAELERKLSTAKESIETLNHVALELHGVIVEYRDLPCESLKSRMIDTAERYWPRIKRSD